MSSSELQMIAAELSEIKELLSSFSHDGLPLRSQVPTSELLASLVASAALLLRDQPLTEGELNGRIQAAQVLARELIRQCDLFQQQTRSAHLAELLQGS